MKVLVTGGCGFIGSNFVHYILQEHRDWQVVNLDNLTYAGNLANLLDIEGDQRYRFVRGDIVDRSCVNELLKERFDWVVNFAAETHVDRSIQDPSPFIKTNVNGTEALLEAARLHDVNGFIQISTDEVYGSLESGSFKETSPLQPNSPYAASKAAADLLCMAYKKTYGVPVIITRSSNNYGPFQFPEKLIPVIIRNALAGRELPIYGEGKQVREWLYVSDNCRAIDIIMQKGMVGAVYNIGGCSEKQNIEVVESILRILAERLKKNAEDFRSLIKHIQDPRGDAHDFRYSLDSSRIREELGWRPLVKFEEGLRWTVEWYLGNLG